MFDFQNVFLDLVNVPDSANFAFDGNGTLSPEKDDLGIDYIILVLAIKRIHELSIAYCCSLRPPLPLFKARIL